MNRFCHKILFGVCLLLIACYPQSGKNGSSATSVQQLLVVITDVDGKTTTSRIIDGNINDKSVIEQFAKNLAKNPGYTYVGGTWNESNQFIGVVNTPAGRMLIGIRAADSQITATEPPQEETAAPSESDWWQEEPTVPSEPFELRQEEPPAPSGPFELWNGFTTDMDKEQVIEKSRQILQVTQTPLDSSNNRQVDFSLTELPDTGPIRFTQGSSEDRIINNRSFIILGLNTESVGFSSTTKVKELDYQCVEVASPMPSYLQEKYGAGGIIENIFFYFYQDKLFAVIIRWSRDIETGKFLVERYGDCTAIMNSISMGEIYQTWAVWKLSDRLIYSYITKATRERTTCYISRNYVENAIDDFERRESVRKAEEEAKRKAAIEGAVF